MTVWSRAARGGQSTSHRVSAVGELDPLVRTLAAIVAEGGSDGPLRICQAAVAALAVDGASITVMTGTDHQEPICASDDVARHVDELQFSLGEGPCIDAHTFGRPVLVPNVLDPDDKRWPMFVNGLRATPVKALHVIPLQTGAVRLGVMDLYSITRRQLRGVDLAGALRAADAALWTLLGLRAGKTLEDTEQLDWFAGSPLRRAEIHQATGMVIAQLGATAETALARLRAHAFVHDQSINDVARDVIERRLRFDKEHP